MGDLSQYSDAELEAIAGGASQEAITPKQSTTIDEPSPGLTLDDIRSFIGGPLRSGIVETAKGGLRGIASGVGGTMDVIANMSPSKDMRGTNDPGLGGNSENVKSVLEYLAGQSIDAEPQNVAERYAGEMADATAAAVSFPGGKMKDAAKIGSIFGAAKQTADETGAGEGVQTGVGIFSSMVPSLWKVAGKGAIKKAATVLKNQPEKLENASYGVTKADLATSGKTGGVGPEGTTNLSEALNTVRESGSAGGVLTNASERAAATKQVITDLDSSLDGIISKLDARKGARKLKPGQFTAVENYLESLEPEARQAATQLAVKKINAIYGELKTKGGSFRAINDLKRKYWNAAYNEENGRVVNDLDRAFGSDLRAYMETAADTLDVPKQYGMQMKQVNRALGDHIAAGKIFDRQAVKTFAEDFLKVTNPRLWTTGGKLIGPSIAFGVPGMVAGGLLTAADTPIGKRAIAAAIRSGLGVNPQSASTAARGIAPTLINAAQGDD